MSTGTIVAVVALIVVGLGGIGVGIYFGVKAANPDQVPCNSSFYQILEYDQTQKFANLQTGGSVATFAGSNQQEYVYFTFDFSSHTQRKLYLNGPDWSVLLCNNTLGNASSTSFKTDLQVDVDGGIVFAEYDCGGTTTLSNPGDAHVEARFVNGTLLWKNDHYLANASNTRVTTAMEFEPLSRSLYYGLGGVFSANTVLYKVDIMTGATLWSKTIPIHLGGLAANTAHLFTASYNDCKVQVLNTDDGSLATEFLTSGFACSSIAIDSDENVYLAFLMLPGFEFHDFVTEPYNKITVAKYNTMHMLVWAKQFGSYYNFIQDRFKFMAYHNGNVYVTWDQGSDVAYLATSLATLSAGSGSISIQNITAVTPGPTIMKPIVGNTLYVSTLYAITPNAILAVRVFCL